MIRRIVEDYECRLAPPDPAVSGPGATGKAERERFANGDEEMEVRVRKLDLPDGIQLDVLLNGGNVGGIEVQKGRGEIILDSRKRAGVPKVAAGDRIAVLRGGTPLLEGTFMRTERTALLIYRVRIHGTGFVMEMESGERERKGFYVNRWVEASSAVEAGRLAVELVRGDRRVVGQVALRLTVENAEPDEADPEERNRSGFAFYDDDSPEH